MINLKKLFKVEIFKMALGYNIDADKIWPCYKNGETICGVCESCKRFLNAKKEAEALI